MARQILGSCAALHGEAATLAYSGEVLACLTALKFWFLVKLFYFWFVVCADLCEISRIPFEWHGEVDAGECGAVGVYRKAFFCGGAFAIEA